MPSEDLIKEAREEVNHRKGMYSRKGVYSKAMGVIHYPESTHLDLIERLVAALEAAEKERQEGRGVEIKDPVEKSVAGFLSRNGIRYIHESEGAELDFYLPDYNVHIECKAFSCDRTARQIKDKDVILVQGYKAAQLLNSLPNPPIEE